MIMLKHLKKSKEGGEKVITWKQPHPAMEPATRDTLPSNMLYTSSKHPYNIENRNSPMHPYSIENRKSSKHPYTVT